MSRYLSSVNWDEFFSVNFTADAIWDGFCDILNNAVEQFIPVKCTVKNNTRKQIKHYPCSIKKALARKKCLQRQMRTAPHCIETKTAYKAAAAKYKILVRNYEIKKERRVITAYNNGSFYNFINRRLSCKSGI